MPGAAQEKAHFSSELILQSTSYSSTILSLKSATLFPINGREN